MPLGGTAARGTLRGVSDRRLCSLLRIIHTANSPVEKILRPIADSGGQLGEPVAREFFRLVNPTLNSGMPPHLLCPRGNLLVPLPARACAQHIPGHEAHNQTDLALHGAARSLKFRLCSRALLSPVMRLVSAGWCCSGLLRGVSD